MTTNNLQTLTSEQAEQAISYAKSGASDAEIAGILRVDPDALRSIAGQMAACRMKMKLAVSRTLLRNAAKGDRVAARIIEEKMKAEEPLTEKCQPPDFEKYPQRGFPEDHPISLRQRKSEAETRLWWQMVWVCVLDWQKKEETKCPIWLLDTFRTLSGHRKFRTQAALDAYPNEYELLSKNVDEEFKRALHPDVQAIIEESW